MYCLAPELTVKNYAKHCFNYDRTLKKVLETTYVVRPLTLVVTLDSESQKL